MMSLSLGLCDEVVARWLVLTIEASDDTESEGLSGVVEATKSFVSTVDDMFLVSCIYLDWIFCL